MTSGFPAGQLFDAAEERLANHVGVAQATGGLGHRRAASRSAGRRSSGEGLPDVANRPVIVVWNHSRWADHRLVNRMIGVGVLGRRVDEGTAAEAGPPEFIGDALRDVPQDVGGRFAAGQCPVDLRAVVLVYAAQIRHNQVFLGRDVPVEGGTGDLGLGDGAVYADGMDASRVEDPGRGTEKPFPGLGGVRSGRCEIRGKVSDRTFSLEGVSCRPIVSLPVWLDPGIRRRWGRCWRFTVPTCTRSR